MDLRGRLAVVTIGALLTVVLASAAGCATSQQAPGRIELSTTSFDFGAIPNTDPVSEVFQVRNVGGGPLAIAGVSTSCGCTTARVNGRELGPGEKADLIVTYDPQAHGGETGEFVRVVYVRSSDPDSPEVSLTMRVTVVEPREAG